MKAKRSEQDSDSSRCPEKDPEPEAPESLTTSSTEQQPRADADLERLQLVITSSSVQTTPFTNELLQIERQLDIQCTKSIPVTPQKTADGTVLIDWYTTDDPENPQNWSSFKKAFIVFVKFWYTFVTYIAGSLWVTSEPGIVQKFGVSPIAAELGLALFVFGYGIGPLLFGPLTEIPIIGRNNIYYLTFIVYFALFFPPPVINSFGGLSAVRFLQGFFGVQP